jgi:hypothetical protein
MTVYKVSYVVTGSDFPGTIANSEERPQIGDRITLGDRVFEITEVIDLLPPRGEFHYVHATCMLVSGQEK